MTTKRDEDSILRERRIEMGRNSRPKETNESGEHTILVLADEGLDGDEGTVSFSLTLPRVFDPSDPPNIPSIDLSELTIDPVVLIDGPKTLDAFHQSVCADVSRTGRSFSEPGDDWRSLITVESGTERGVMSLHELVEGFADGDRQAFWSWHMPMILRAVGVERAALTMSVWVGEEEEAVTVISASPSDVICSHATIRRDGTRPPTLDVFVEKTDLGGPALKALRLAVGRPSAP